MEQHEPKGQILEIATNIYLLPWQPIASPIITSMHLFVSAPEWQDSAGGVGGHIIRSAHVRVMKAENSITLPIYIEIWCDHA